MTRSPRWLTGTRTRAGLSRPDRYQGLSDGCWRHAATGAREGEPDRGASGSFGKDRWCYQREPHAGLREVPSRKLRDSAAAGGDEHVPPSPGETFRYSRRVPVALETALATSCMVNGGPPSSYAAFRWLSWVSAVMQAAA